VNGLEKHSVVVSGHRTSVSIETPFWDELTAIAGRRGTSVNRLIAEIDRTRAGNLSSAIRLFVLQELRRAQTVAARRNAG
jgi:predicted DNA-binding ribbon-helix-helix protein